MMHTIACLIYAHISEYQIRHDHLSLPDNEQSKSIRVTKTFTLIRTVPLRMPIILHIRKAAFLEMVHIRLTSKKQHENTDVSCS